jgi:hypothetical protein
MKLLLVKSEHWYNRLIHALGFSITWHRSFLNGEYFILKITRNRKQRCDVECPSKEGTKSRDRIT